jgi:hypothetical protein
MTPVISDKLMSAPRRGLKKRPSSSGYTKPSAWQLAACAGTFSSNRSDPDRPSFASLSTIALNMLMTIFCLACVSTDGDNRLPSWSPNRMPILRFDEALRIGGGL